MQVVVLHGPPLIGKGTQADFMVGQGFFHLSPGAYIREKIAEGDPKFQAVAAIINAGDLVPDEMVAEIIDSVIDEKMEQGFKGVLLDGCPRNLNQARLLDQTLADKNLPLTVIELYTDDDENLNARRLKRIKEYTAAGKPPRPDDEEKVFRHRLQVYHNLTEPVSEYYEAKGLLKKIDGFLPLQTIRNIISSYLNLGSAPGGPSPSL
jgi:adenylate kinase